MADPVLATPAVSAAPDLGMASAATHMALGLLLVLAVILAAFWVLRRFGPKFGLGPVGRGGMLRIVSQLPLGQRKSLVVVRFLNKDLLLGVTDQTITMLTEGASTHETDTAFADTLARAGNPPGDDPAAKS